MATKVPLTWGKSKYLLTIDKDTITPTSLMEQVQQLTQVQVLHQKLFAKKGWKGILTPTTTLIIKPGKTTMTLMGSATETITTMISAPTDISFDEDNIATITLRLRAQLLGNLTPTTAIKTSTPYATSQNTQNGSWSDIRYQDPASTQWQPGQHLRRVAALSRTYALTGDSAMLVHINLGLEFWLVSNLKCNNWWYNDIYVPRLLGEIVVLITSTPRTNDIDLCPSVQKVLERCDSIRHEKTYALKCNSGANLMDAMNNTIHCACAENNLALMEYCADRIHKENGMATTLNREGLQVDGSFHQHGSQQAIMSYGLEQSKLLSSFAVLFHQTKYAFSVDALHNLATLILQGQQWFVFRNQIDYHACGRGAFRGTSNVHCYSGHRSLHQLLTRMMRVDDQKSKEYERFLKRLVSPSLHATTTDFVKNEKKETGPGERKEDATNRRNQAVEHTGPLGNTGPLGTKYFYRSDTLVHRTTRWYFSCRYHSIRCLPTETDTNRENIQGFHLADGCHFVMQHGDEYHNVQPMLNYRRLPGVTCLNVNASHPLPVHKPHVGRSNTTFVGCATDTDLGASVMDYRKAGIACKKAMFIGGSSFEGIVSMGTGIVLDAGTRTADVVPPLVKTSAVTTSISQRRHVLLSERSPSRSEQRATVTGGLEKDKSSVVVLKKWQNGKYGTKGVHLGDTEYHCEAACHDGIAYVLLNDAVESTKSKEISGGGSGGSGGSGSGGGGGIGGGNGGGNNGDGLTVQVATQTGSWRLVQDSASANTLSQDIFSVWINHGNDVGAGTGGGGGSTRFAYRIIPGMVQDEQHGSPLPPTTTLQDFLLESSKAIVVLSNTIELQAIRTLTSTLAIFHLANTILDTTHFNAKMTTDIPCACTIRGGNPYVLAVADPSQNYSTISITLDGLFEVVVDGIGQKKRMPGVQCQHIKATGSRDNVTILTIALPEGIQAGKSVVVSLVEQQ